MPTFTYEIGAERTSLHNPKVGDTISIPCPECEEVTLTVYDQESRFGHEYYMECNDEQCGACFYPQP